VIETRTPAGVAIGIATIPIASNIAGVKRKSFMSMVRRLRDAFAGKSPQNICTFFQNPLGG
jgi:hypothetical protein